MFKLSPLVGRLLVIAGLGLIAHPSPASGFIVANKRVGGIINLYRMNLDGSNEVALTNFGGDAYGPSISPDGSKIAFHSYHTGYAQIFVMNSDGTGLQQLTFGAQDSMGPVWSPDGSRLAFQSRFNGLDDIMMMSATGSNLVNLTNTPGITEGAIDWSRTNGMLAFSRGVNGTGDIWKMQSDGSGQTQLTSGGWDEWAPKWSTDGTRIAYHALAGGAEWRGWIMGSDGTNQHVFTQLLGSHAYPDFWDGNRLLLHATPSTSNPWGLFWLNADGTGLQLIREGEYVGGATAWVSSPVPEPCTVVFGGLGLAAAVLRRRK